MDEECSEFPLFLLLTSYFSLFIFQYFLPTSSGDGASGGARHTSSLFSFSLQLSPASPHIHLVYCSPRCILVPSFHLHRLALKTEKPQPGWGLSLPLLAHCVHYLGLYSSELYFFWAVITGILPSEQRLNSEANITRRVTADTMGWLKDGLDFFSLKFLSLNCAYWTEKLSWSSSWKHNYYL